MDRIFSENKWPLVFLRPVLAPERQWHTILVVTIKIGQYSLVNILLFYNGRENYFKTKPFQPDYEEFFEDDKQDQVWFESIINPELLQQLLSYGKDVEILEPESLKNQMKEHAENMKNYYSK